MEINGICPDRSKIRTHTHAMKNQPIHFIHFNAKLHSFLVSFLRVDTKASKHSRWKKMKRGGCHTGVWESKPSASAAAAAAASRPPGKKRESESLLYPCRKFSFYFSIFLWQRFQSKSGFLSSWFFKRPQSQGDIFAPTFVRVCWSLQLCRQQFFKV